MKTGLAVCGAFVVGSALTLLAAAPWQDAKAKAKPGGDMPAMSAEDQAAFMKFATPGAEHKALASMAGKWSVTSECWMDPSAPPMQSTGTSEFKTIMDGRFVMEDCSSTSAMGPMHGMGILGFNNGTQKYEHVWLFDMGTAMMFAEGEKKGDTCSFTSESFCPIKKVMAKERFDVRHVNDNDIVMEMYTTYPGQPEYKSMLLHYTRSAGAR